MVERVSPSHRLNIVIIGAGIAGLATAATLSQLGHNVTVLERHPVLHEFGASIEVRPNAVRCLHAWGLAEDFGKIVSRPSHREIRDGLTGKLIVKQSLNIGNSYNIRYGGEHWDVNRKHYQDTLAKAAFQNGTKIVFAVDIRSIDVDKCSVDFVLRDTGGTLDQWVYSESTDAFRGHPSDTTNTITADVIIGADGMRSTTRNAIPATANIEPIPLFSQLAYRCTIPRERVETLPSILPDPSSPNNPGMTYSSPGRYILTWPLTAHQTYDIVLAVQTTCDIPPGRWGTPVSLEEARSHFQDFCPVAKELISHIDAAVKWQLGELPPLRTCKSENGRVVLIGDAWHAMLPHSGSGGSSAIEDATCLTICLDWASKQFYSASTSKPISGFSISSNSSSDNTTKTPTTLHEYINLATQAYETLRKPRVERMQLASHEGYNYHNTVDQETRAAALRAAAQQFEEDCTVSEEERRRKPKPAPDVHAKYPLPEYLQWLYEYDTVAITREYLEKLG